MSWLWVVVCAVGLLLQKVAGAFVPRRLVSGARTRRVLTLLPVAMLAALALTQSLGGGDGVVLDARLAGVAAAVVALLLRAPFLVAVVAAAATAAWVRLLG